MVGKFKIMQLLFRVYSKSINKIIKSESVINIIGCGRTDKGVHAENFIFM